MPIGEVVKLLTAFQRYVDYMNNHGFDDVIDSIKKNWNSLIITMRGHMGEKYDFEVYFSGTTGELCIDDPITHVSVFDILDFEEYEITEEKLLYLKCLDTINFRGKDITYHFFWPNDKTFCFVLEERDFIDNDRNSYAIQCKYHIDDDKWVAEVWLDAGEDGRCILAANTSEYVSEQEIEKIKNFAIQFAKEK